MAITYSYKITPTGRVTYLKNGKRVAKKEIPAETLKTLEFEIAAKKGAPAPKKRVTKKRTEVAFEEEAIPLPEVLNPTEKQIGDLLIIENYNKCSEKCNWKENACNIDTGRCIKKTKSGGVPKAYKSAKVGEKTIVSKKLSESELKDEIQVLLKKAPKKKKASAKKKAPAKKKTPKKALSKRTARVEFEDKISENLSKCKEKCEWGESVCNVDTGRCIKKTKAGAIPRTYKDYTHYDVNDEITIVTKKFTKSELEKSLGVKAPPKKKPAKKKTPAKKKAAPKKTPVTKTKKKAKRCDDETDYIECPVNKVCSATSGRCVADTSRNRAGMMQLRVGDRTIIGKAATIARLEAMFPGSKMEPAFKGAKVAPPKAPSAKRVSEKRVSRYEEEIRELHKKAFSSANTSLLEELRRKSDAISERLNSLSDSSEVSKLRGEWSGLNRSLSISEKRYKTFSDRAENLISKSLKKLTGDDSKDKKVEESVRKSVEQAVSKLTKREDLEELSDRFNSIQERLGSLRKKTSPRRVTFEDSQGTVELPRSKPPSFVEPEELEIPVKSPMEIIIPTPSARLSGVMRERHPDFERVVDTGLKETRRSSERRPPAPLPVVAAPRTEKPDIVGKAEADITEAFRRCLATLDK